MSKDQNPRFGLSGRARLSDVAEAANVSLGSASKALSAPDSVRPKTLERVREAADRLGYFPSHAGRALASRSTRMIGVVMPSIYQPVYARFFHLMQDALLEHDYLALALSYDFDRSREHALIERLVRCGVDAVILIGTDHDPRTIALLEKTGVPYVFSWVSDDNVPAGSAGFSNRIAMHAVVAHLAGLGHKRIVMANGDTRDNERARARLAGVEEAAAAHAMTLVDVLTVPLTIAGGAQGYERLKPVRHGVTALICSADLVAAGALDAALRDGVAVPDELSITGFDAIEMAFLLRPALTTVKVPLDDLVAQTAQSVVAALKKDPLPPGHIFEARLVVGQSTGPARIGNGAALD